MLGCDCSFDSKKDSKKNDAIKKDLSRIVEADVQEWVVDELAQNRQRKAVKEKVCYFRGLYQ